MNVLLILRMTVLQEMQTVETMSDPIHVNAWKVGLQKAFNFYEIYISNLEIQLDHPQSVIYFLNNRIHWRWYPQLVL